MEQRGGKGERWPVRTIQHEKPFGLNERHGVADAVHSGYITVSIYENEVPWCLFRHGVKIRSHVTRLGNFRIN